MDDLLADFVAETREMLEAMEGELVAWERAPGDRARLDAIFRFVHTVKGNCGFFDLPRLEQLSHAAEGALADVRAGQRQPDSDLVSAVLAIIDRIMAMIDAIEAGVDFPLAGDDALIARLDADAEPVCGEDAGDPDTQRGGTVAKRSIRLPVELLDRLMGGVSDLVLARNELSRRLRDAGMDATLHGSFERLSTILDDVREGITRMRMQRIEHLFASFPRLVRDLSAELSKQVMIDFEGGDVEIDREMVEVIRDPLTHIIRNAIDHGIESPAQRLAVGKREIGLLHFSARQSGNRITIAISDDGRGIDSARLVEKAVAAGLATAAECAAMSEAERLQLVFEPGLSTAPEITSISGRGVGMDVVRANIERVEGTVSIASRPGEGTQIMLSLPLTLSIVPSLTVECAGHRYGVPRSFVDEIFHARSSAVEQVRVGSADLVTIRGQRLRCIDLAAALEQSGDGGAFDGNLLMIRLTGGEQFGLRVGKVLDHEDLVIQPLSPVLMESGLFAGTTLLEDGQPLLMLDMAGIARAHGLQGDIRRRSAAPSPQAANDVAAQTAPGLLFVALDGQKRLMRLDLVARIEKVDAAAIRLGDDADSVVLEGRIVPLAGASAGHLPDGQVTILRLSDGVAEIAYAAQRIVDTAAIGDEFVPARTPGEVEGTALLGEEVVDVVDCHWLFARQAPRPAAGGHAGTCRLDLDDAWVRALLMPLVAAAGYRVIDRNAPETADVALVLDGPQGQGDTGAGDMRRIVLTAAPTAPEEGQVYRYDRAGLLAALSTLPGQAA